MVRRQDAGGFTLIDSAYAPDLSIPRHSHENAYLCAVLTGGYTERYGARERACSAGAIVLHPPGEMHADQFYRGGGRCLNIELSPARLAGLEKHPILEGGAADTPGPLARWLVVRLCRELTTRDSAAVLAMEGLALELLAEMARSTPLAEERERTPWLQGVRDLLHERFRENLSLVQIAEAAAVHPTHLARSFRRSFRCTVGQYVRRLRVEHACRALAEGELTLSEIALECGFYDHSQLSRTFKAHTGLTPSEYRRDTPR